VSTHDEQQEPAAEPAKPAKRGRSAFSRRLDPFWWASVDFRWWMSDPGIRRLTHEQRGRFMDMWALICGNTTPGVCTEEDVRAWAGYTPPEWKAVRPVFVPLFRITRGNKWILETVVEAHQAALNAHKTRLAVSRAGVEKRRSNKGLATDGSPPVLPGVLPEVGKARPPKQPPVNRHGSPDMEMGRFSEPSVPREIDRSAVTGLSGLSRPETGQRAPAGGETRDAAAQSADACFRTVDDMLAGVLADGQRADARPQRGGAA